MSRVYESIRKWAQAKLGIEELQHDNAALRAELQKYQDEGAKQYGDLNGQCMALFAQANNAVAAADAASYTSKLLIERFEIAADINQYEDSWAVFVVKGRTPLVHFIDLRGVQPREIEELVMRYQGVKSTLDTPFAAIRKPKSIREFL